MSDTLRLLETPSLYETVPDALVTRILGRDRSLFEYDMTQNVDAIAARFAGRRVLVVGAAGSIGAATVKAICALGPKKLVLVDISENALADLVRTLRAGRITLPPEFATSVVAAGSDGFARFFAAEGPFDLTMNFAALKHVRSERDPYSLVRMIDTNVLAVDQMISLAAEWGGRLFSVSSDKAVNPANLMGASKRWMELLLADGRADTASARFANVAFSAGSLPNAICQRLIARQPIGAPNDVRRYFISHREAAELCILASALGESAEIFVPKLEAPRDLIAMTTIAEQILAYCGLAPELHESDASAKASPSLSATNPTQWPCVFGTSSTAGEKPYEELLLSREPVDAERFGTVAVSHISPAPTGALHKAAAALAELKHQPDWCKPAIVEILQDVVPELGHIESDASLDGKL